MMNIINKIKFWYGNSRPYTIPITFLSWLAIYVYALKSGGNPFLGLIAYIGVAIVHLATNLSDDYFDYKRLCKHGEFSTGEKSAKCKYLKDGSATISDLRNAIMVMLGFSAFIGFVLCITSGWGVAIFAIAALPIAVFYSKFSNRGIGDIAVILAYGPLMYEGVYYVMTSSVSVDVLVLSVVSGVIVNTILYAHMLMDYDGDIQSEKTTLCTRLGSKENALRGLLFFYLVGYLFIGIFSLKIQNYLYFLPFLTLPFVFDLYKSLKLYNKNSKALPIPRFWHYPLDNWKQLQYHKDAPFFFRFFYVRNITVYFMLLLTLAIAL